MQSLESVVSDLRQLSPQCGGPQAASSGSAGACVRGRHEDALPEDRAIRESERDWDWALKHASEITALDMARRMGARPTTSRLSIAAINAGGRFGNADMLAAWLSVVDERGPRPELIFVSESHMVVQVP